MKVADLQSLRQVETNDGFRNYLSKQQDVGEFSLINNEGKKCTILHHAIRIAKDFNLSVMMDITERKEMEER